MSIFKTLFVTEILHILEAKFDKPESFPMNNRTSYGICFASSGEVIYKHMGRSYVCNKSQAVVIPMNSSYIVECDSTGSFPIINFLATKQFTLDEFVEIPLKNPSLLLNYFYSMQNANSTKNITGNAHLLSLFYRIIDALNHEENFQNQSSISNIIEFINQNFSDPSINNQTLADRANLSVSHFRLLFKTSYNTSPMNYIYTLRIEKAKQMLINTHVSISQISEECGFASLYSFSRAFKTSVGISPSDFAKQNRVNVI